MSNALLLCPWSAPTLLFFSSDPGVPQLLYYAYLPLIIIIGFFAGFVFVKSKQSVLSTIFLLLAGIFIAWLLNEIVQWTENLLVVQMFAWQLIRFFETAVFLAVAFFCIYFFTKGKPSFWTELLLVLLALPVLILLPTHFNIESFYLTSDDCGGNYGILRWYVYFAQVASSLVILSSAIKNYRKEIDIGYKKQILIISIGALCFMAIMLSVSLFSDFFLTYEINLVSPIGMVVFLSLLTFMIVRFKAFDVRVFGAQALVFALIALIGSEFFFIRTNTNRILVSITLVVTGFIGINLIRSVKREIKQREELAIANAGQENLIHIMNHQIKGYLTKARNIFAELKSEPEYCPAESAKPMLDEGFKSLTEGVDFVQQVLQGSSASSGKLVYNLLPLDFRTLVLQVIDTQKHAALAKHLSLDIDAPEGVINVKADDIQLKEAVRNLIDNSIRYTMTGGLNIKVEKSGNKALLTVKDTGVGINAEDKQKLFQKGGRGKDSLKYNVNSTGYGLAFVKGVVEAHNGRVWAESLGEGTGSTFYLELPLA